MEAIQKFTAKVLLVQPNPNLRSAMAAALRSFGYQSVQGVADLKMAWAHMEAEDIDWLITSVLIESPMNALQVLTSTQKHKDLNKVLVTLLTTDADFHCIDYSFTQGLLCWHPMPNSQTAFQDMIKEFLHEANNVKGNRMAFSAVYLRKKLIEDKRFKELVDFETKLSALLGDDINQLFHLALAQIRAFQYALARSTLWLIAQKDPASHRLSAMIEMLNSIPEAMSTKPLEGSGPFFLCDPDDHVRAAVAKCIEELGCQDVRQFPDGESCWASIAEGNVPAIFMTEWRVPKLSGLQLIQRLRGASHHETLVLVGSSIITAKDAAILKEMTVMSVLPKPFGTGELTNCLTWMASQFGEPTDLRMLTIKLRAKIRANSLGEGAALLEVLQKRAGADNPLTLEMCAELAFSKGQAEEAKRYLIQSLTKSPGSITALSLLGKSLLQLGQTAEAIKVMEKAQQISPANVERLCTIAEAHSDLGNEAAAQTAIEGAAALVGTNQHVIGTALNLALVAGDLSKAKVAMSSLYPIETMMRFMNNKAVALSRSTKLTEAIKIYANALEVVPDTEKTVRTTITINLALAYLRTQQLTQAKDLLLKLKLDTTSAAMQKAKRLLKIIGAAETSGKSVKFSQSQLEAKLPDKDVLKLLAQESDAESMKRTIDLAIFPKPEPAQQEKIAPLIEQLPRFVPRRQSVNGTFVA